MSAAAASADAACAQPAAASAAAAASDVVTRVAVVSVNYRLASEIARGLRPGFDASRAALQQAGGPFLRWWDKHSAAPPAAFPDQFPLTPAKDAVDEMRAQLVLAPRDPAEIAALQGYLAGRPPLNAVCGHASPSSCYWCSRGELLKLPYGAWPFSTCGHGENEKSILPSCVTGEISYEEDRWSWRQASDRPHPEQSVALARYHADRLRMIELFRLKRAALLVDIRLLHGAQWPVAFGCLAGVEPLRQSFAALLPVAATPATLADLAAMADHEEAQMTAAEAGSEAYLRADAYARDQAAKRCIFSEFSSEDAHDWRRERGEWERLCHIPNMTRREFYLETICDAGLIADLAALVLAYVEPPSCAITRRYPVPNDTRPVQPFEHCLGAIPHDSRVVAVAINLRTAENGYTRLVLRPAVHSQLLEAIEANPDVKARLAQHPLDMKFVWELSSPPLTAASATYVHEMGFQVPEEAGWGALWEIKVSASGDRNYLYCIEVFYVEERKDHRSKIRATPNYHALHASVPPREFEEEEVERGWRYCTACAQLWLGDASGGGVCPAKSVGSPSRAHTGLSDWDPQREQQPQGLVETRYALVSQPLGGAQPEGTQADWRRCRACAVLFHGPSAHNSCCPAAASALGPHDATDSLEYFVHAGGLCDAPQAAFSEPRWRQCRDCSALVRFKGVCPAKTPWPHKLSGLTFAPLLAVRNAQADLAPIEGKDEANSNRIPKRVIRAKRN